MKAKLKQNGYFLIKIGNRTVDLYLWSEDEEMLNDIREDGMTVVPNYVRGKKHYLKINGQLVEMV